MTDQFPGYAVPWTIILSKRFADVYSLLNSKTREAASTGSTIELLAPTQINNWFSRASEHIQQSNISNNPGLFLFFLKGMMSTLEYSNLFWELRHCSVFCNNMRILKFRDLLRKIRWPLEHKHCSLDQDPCSEAPDQVLVILCLITEEMDQILISHPLPLFGPAVYILWIFRKHSRHVTTINPNHLINCYDFKET